ncbi:hypothetical protein ACJMK2_032271 [Sinanodonta woodiana]|uniref:Neuronal membrane glycoprotein M6-a n=1 Tax=Sinanodonta woodiana TaxID=1069815 RepID=A0ABD3X184_SINWO
MEITEKVGNCPFASLIATLIVFAGVGTFCGTLYRALAIFLEKIMNELFGFSVTWLSVIQVVFVVVAVVMGLFAILLLVFGFLATGATRKNVYSGARCIMGGRVSAAFFMVICYLLNMAWMCITAACVVPVILYVSINSICNNDIYNKNANSVTTCIKLSQFGIYRNQTLSLGISALPGKDQLCEQTELSRFCDRIVEAGPLFCVAFAGAFLIVLGLTHFMICLSANYTRIKISKELTEYRDAVDTEELELENNYDKSLSRI